MHMVSKLAWRPVSYLRYTLRIQMVRWHEGEDLAGDNTTGADTLQVYVARAEGPVVESYACRDCRSNHHTLYAHLGVPSAVQLVMSY